MRKELSANSFQEFLKDKKDKEAKAALAAKKVIVVKPITNPDADFLENIKHLDNIMAKTKRTAVDEEIIKIMLERHDSYKQYFLNNIGNNGVV